jgi:hypothetical protein
MAAQTGGAADLDVGHGVTDEDKLRRRSVEDVEGTEHGVGVRLHQLGPTRDAADSDAGHELMAAGLLILAGPFDGDRLTAGVRRGLNEHRDQGP